MHTELLCLGGSCVDLVLRVPRMPQRDEKMVTEFVGRVGGGLIANTACAAARLGLRVGWAGVIGDDDSGAVLRRDFAAFGVDDALAQVRPNQATDFTVILLDNSGERTILIAPTIGEPPALTPSLQAALKHARIVYTLPHPPHWFEPMAQAAHAGDGLVAVDVEQSAPARGEDLQAALALADMVFCNARGLQYATDCPSIVDGANKLLAGRARCVVVTLGSGGARAYTTEGIAEVAGYEVPVVDTTGAGDCFHAAFMSAYLRREPPAACLAFANAAAALSVQAVGARGGFPTREQVEALMGRQ